MSTFTAMTRRFTARRRAARAWSTRRRPRTRRRQQSDREQDERRRRAERPVVDGRHLLVDLGDEHLDAADLVAALSRLNHPCECLTQDRPLRARWSALRGLLAGAASGRQNQWHSGWHFLFTTIVSTSAARIARSRTHFPAHDHPLVQTVFPDFRSDAQQPIAACVGLGVLIA